MKKADVIFRRTGLRIEIMLYMDGLNIARSTSVESIVRELAIHQVSALGFENLFFTELPTAKASLVAAQDVPFSEPMAAMWLIAACTSLVEVSSHTQPERRAIPRPEKPFLTTTMH